MFFHSGAIFLLYSLISVAQVEIPADVATNSYNNEFYHVANGDGYFFVDTNKGAPGRGQFWRVCEQIEAIEDAFQRNREPTYGSMIGELVNGLNNVVSKTASWDTWNIYNDDIMWGVIALVRSFILTGNKEHLSQAEYQFNAAWARGWDTENGGMYWNTDKETKNACVNGPTAIAAYLLGQHTSNTGYASQGKKAWDWLRKNLFNGTTGQVYDHVKADGSITDWAFTYNQGTFIGAATMFDAIPEAQLAIQWTRATLTGQHKVDILNDEYGSEGGNDDGVGFKGIFMRWCDYYAHTQGDIATQQWLTKNAQAAWDNRNNVGVTWAMWWQRTTDVPGYLTSWECSSALAAAQIHQTT